jgi:hypothetical protein
MAQRRRSRKDPKKEEFEYIGASDEDLEGTDEGVKARKRSQAEIKYKASKKRQDMFVLLIACVLIISILGIYYVSIYTGSTSDSDDDDDKVEGATGNLTANLFVISDISHNWTKESWHIMNVNGITHFLLKIENTGDIEDTYILDEDNKNPKIKINFNKNDITLKPGKATVAIVNVSNTMGSEYRIPNPIHIELKSITTKTIMDEVKLEITIDKLENDEIALNGDKVSAYYTGAFQNGTLFDYSLRDPQATDPLRISLLKDQEQLGYLESVQYTPVIEGFRRGLIGMVPGETLVISVPPGLGYPSDHELGGDTLIFEVRLLSNDRDA